MKLIDGKELARNLRGEIAAGVAALKAEKGITPGLAVILVGDNPASVSYVTAKEKACTEAGMLSREIRLPAETTEEELVALVKKLNCDPEIHGILVQLPVPKHIRDKAVIDAIAPEKDVDGFTPINVGKMMIGDECFLPCTPHGIIKLIEFSGMDIRGKHAVVMLLRFLPARRRTRLSRSATRERLTSGTSRATQISSLSRQDGQTRLPATCLKRAQS